MPTSEMRVDNSGSITAEIHIQQFVERSKLEVRFALLTSELPEEVCRRRFHQVLLRSIIVSLRSFCATRSAARP